MSDLPLRYSLMRWPEPHRFGPLDWFLILLGAGIAYWLMPVLGEGFGQ